MSNTNALQQFTRDSADCITAIDSTTTGQYGDGIGSEDEDRQLDLLVEALQEADPNYRAAKREVPYPEQAGRCDLLLPEDVPIEVKLIRYWRANGDPEPNMYRHVFSPFHRNTLLTDADQLHSAAFDGPKGLLGLFYVRSDDDPETIEAHPEGYTASNIAEKIVEDIDYWYGIEASICEIARFSGLQHTVHTQGAVISWLLE